VKDEQRMSEIKPVCVAKSRFPRQVIDDNISARLLVMVNGFRKEHAEEISGNDSPRGSVAQWTDSRVLCERFDSLDDFKRRVASKTRCARWRN